MRISWRVVLLFASIVPAPCRADVVNDVYDLAFKTAMATPPLALRTLAIVNLAMFDAANAIDRRYQPYRAQPVPPPGADANGAALGAGCAALEALQQVQRADIAKECDRIAAGLATAKAVEEGRRFGESTGTALVEARRDDGYGVPNTYRPAASPGVYVPTTLPIGSEVAVVHPFAMSSPSQFRAPPPPALSGEVWARDYNEVKRLGGRQGSERTPTQTATAYFFASAGPQQFLDSLPDISAKTGANAADRARYFALVYMTLHDASVAHFDSKYAYNFWRPVTAIRNGDLDGNEATERDPTWMPLIETPMHPEYPCAHCTVTAAFAVVVFSFLDKSELPLRSAAIPGRPVTTRKWSRAADVAADVADARVWSGVHFRNSTAAGVAMGTSLGEWVLATQLRQLR